MSAVLVLQTSANRPAKAETHGVYNAAGLAKAEAGSSFDPAYSPSHAVDGGYANAGSRWLSAKSDEPQWFVLSFAQRLELRALLLYPDWSHRNSRWKFSRCEYQVGDERWRPLQFRQTQTRAGMIRATCSPLRVDAIRLWFEPPADGIVRLYEIEVLTTPPPGWKPDLDAKLPGTLNIDLAAVDAKNPKVLSLGKLNWRFHQGDYPGWAAPDYGDSKWSPIEVGKPWNQQGFRPGFGWYRTAFTLPADWAGKSVVLDLGKISFYDRVYINGQAIGTTGRHPPKPPIIGSSFMRRVYYVPADMLNASGTQSLAIRCYAGSRFGMHRGPYRALLVDGHAVPEVLFDFADAATGDAQVARLVNGQRHLNVYAVGDVARIALQVMPLKHLPLGTATLRLTQYDANGQVHGQWSDAIVRHAGSQTESKLIAISLSEQGRYGLVAELLQGAHQLAVAKTELTVRTPLTSRLRVEPKLVFPAMPAKAPKLHTMSVGRFGGTQFTGDRKIRHDYATGNADGTLTFNVLVREDHAGPLLFTTDVQATPTVPYNFRYYLQQPSNAGSIEGRSGAWSVGEVHPAGVKEPTRIEAITTNWLLHHCRYLYDKAAMDVTYSLGSPGMMVETGAKRVTLFGGIQRFGLKPPGHIAYRTSQGVHVDRLTSGNPRNIDRAQQWVLVWFNGADGWNDFDQPWLIVFQRQPVQVDHFTEGLEVSFKQSAGKMWLMPLFGRGVVPLIDTNSWSQGLPGRVGSLADTLAGMMLAYPIAAKETYSLDPDAGSVTIGLHYDYDTTNDDWQTRPLRAAMVPPTVAMVAADGFPVTFSALPTDLGIPTSDGPMLVVTDSDHIIYRIDEGLKLTNEVRQVRGLQPSHPHHLAAMTKLRSEMKRLVREKRLAEHPWKGLWLGAEQPRTVAPMISDLLLARRYLSPAAASQLDDYLWKEIEEVLLVARRLKIDMCAALQNRQ